MEGTAGTLTLPSPLLPPHLPITPDSVAAPDRCSELASASCNARGRSGIRYRSTYVSVVTTVTRHALHQPCLGPRPVDGHAVAWFSELFMNFNKLKKRFLQSLENYACCVGIHDVVCRGHR